MVLSPCAASHNSHFLLSSWHTSFVWTHSPFSLVRLASEFSPTSTPPLFAVQHKYHELGETSQTTMSSGEVSANNTLVPSATNADGAYRCWSDGAPSSESHLTPLPHPLPLHHHLIQQSNVLWPISTWTLLPANEHDTRLLRHPFPSCLSAPPFRIRYLGHHHQQTLSSYPQHHNQP
jgi:hypothetical protein